MSAIYMLIHNDIKKIISENKYDIILIILLLVIGVKYAYNVQLFLDIQLKDETLYLNNGIHMFNLGLPSPQWAPIYSLWYYLLSLIEANSINVYFLNIKVLTIILPVLLYVFLRVERVSKLLAFLTGFFFLVSTANILVNPKVTHFAMMIILISLILFSVTKKSDIKWYIIISGTLLVSYVRPEFFISFILLLVFYLFKTLQTKSFFKERKGITILIISSCILIITFGIPITNSGRAFGAFSQHYSLNWVQWNHSNLNPWTDAPEIIFKSFGNINSVYGAMLSNSGLFFKHIITNINSFNQYFPELINHTVFTSNNYRFVNTELLLLIFVIILSTIYKFYKSKASVIKTIKNNFVSSKNLIIISVTCIIPVTASTLVIYPRQHYLLVLFFFLVIIILPLIRVDAKRTRKGENIANGFVIAIAVSLFLLTPNSSKFYQFYNQSNLETVEYLRSLKITSKVNLLEYNGGYSTYLGTNYSWITGNNKNISFDKFMIKKNINMIIYSGKLGSNKKFKSDSTWTYFLNNYKKFDFTKELIPNSGNELYLKKNLISQM